MRSYITINKKALFLNYQALSKATNKKIIAVVKANGYGLGLKEVSRELNTLGCSFYMVASLQEALILRKNLIFSPILLLENTSDLKTVLSLKLTLAITSFPQLLDLIKTEMPIRVHLMIDSGMERDGINYDEVDKSIELIKKSKLILTGIFTHHSGHKRYKKEYQSFKNSLENINIKNLHIHHQASKTMFLDSDIATHIRIGGALYGLVRDETIDLHSVIGLYSPIWSVKQVKKGEMIGYDDGKSAPEPGYISTIPFGYSDGWDRNRKLIAYLNGEKVNSIGTMMMNHTLFFSKKPPKVGDEVELLGPHLNIFELAKSYKTIPYELTSSLSESLKRFVI